MYGDKNGPHVLSSGEKKMNELNNQKLKVENELRRFNIELVNFFKEIIRP